ncbi:hypothetical protein [Acidisphaera sp. L21]|jgi:hypothetical protein|uniref:hypothetical protein n=1 Tax=Acidisphaera sp. L21 TaxID=1641851 RepID=UPI00131AD8A6|nr:hypothetical protein [Acidisphaera sp. L21]
MPPGSNRLRSRTLVAGLIVSMAGLAGCATTPPPAPVAVVEPPPPEVPPQPPRPLPLPKPVDLRWAFTTTPDACTALASGAGGALQVVTTANHQIVMTARFTPIKRALPARAKQAKLAFNGPAGRWTMPGAWQNREFSVSRPLDERGLASILGLLGGGTAVITAGAFHLGSAHLPPSSADGNAWVQCPKQIIASR